MLLNLSGVGSGVVLPLSLMPQGRLQKLKVAKLSKRKRQVCEEI